MAAFLVGLVQLLHHVRGHDRGRRRRRQVADSAGFGHLIPPGFGHPVPLVLATL